MKIDEGIYKILYDAINVTNKDYKIKWFDKDTYEGFIDGNDLIDLIEDLVYEIDRLNEKIEDLENANDYPNEERDREREVLGI